MVYVRKMGNDYTMERDDKRCRDEMVLIDLMHNRFDMDGLACEYSSCVRQIYRSTIL